MEDQLDAAVSFNSEKLIRGLPAERAAKEGKAYRTDPVQLKLFISQQGKVQGIVFDESITTLAEQAKKQLIVVLRPALAKTKWTAAEKSGRKVNGIVTLNFLMRWQYAVDQFNQKLVTADDILKIELIERYEIFEIVEDEAKPVGGMEGFYKHLEDNIQYPEKARKLGVGGVAYVRFIINAAGDVESAQVVEGRELGYGLDEEAVRLIMLSKWEPGKQRGRAVRQRKLLPVRFKIPR
jgi:TonB family protein